MIKHYSNKQQILLVGEGDFSFALCLAKAFGSASNMVATSLDSSATLLIHYSKAEQNLLELEQRGCTVVHGVNAHIMSQHPDLRLKRFDRIVFNFPHAGFYHTEFQDKQIKIHQKLVKGFFKSAKQMLTDTGEVHVTHKTAYPFSQWEVAELAAEVGLQLLEKAPFFISNYEGYHNKRGSGDDRDKSFPVGECTTFKFILTRSNKINRIRKNIIDINGGSKWIKHYNNKHKILLVGEGDFSFAVSLARAFGSCPNMVATSLDSRGSLLTHYLKANQNLEELEQRGCTVLHGVNAHIMSKDPAIMFHRFDRIVFNFPHAGFYYNENQNEQIKIHQKLIKGFFINAKNIMSDVGEVHVTHKTSHPYSEWKVEEMAEVVGLELVEKAVFSQSDYNGYCIKKGGGKHRNKIYKPIEVYSTTFKFVLPRTASSKEKNKNTIG